MRSFFRLFFIAVFSLTFLSACQSEDDDWGSEGGSSQFFYITVDPAGGEFIGFGENELVCPGFMNAYPNRTIRKSFPIGTPASLDLSGCMPTRYPSEIKINPPDDVYTFTQFCNKRTGDCYLPSELTDIPVDRSALFTAEYKVNRGKVTISANGGYFPNTYSTSRDNVSYVIFADADADGTFDLPLGSMQTVTNPGSKFSLWEVTGDKKSDRLAGGITGLKYTDYSSDITAGITVTAVWILTENCCTVEFRNPRGTDQDIINLFKNNLTEDGKVGYGTQIELPDWYDVTAGDWGGEPGGDTRFALKEWTLTTASNPGTPYQRGRIFTVEDNVVFTATLDSSVLGIATEADLRGINNATGVYRLVDDIALESEWTPIKFTGTLDGGGKTVSGLKFPTAPSQTIIGFFDELAGKVDNVTLEVASGALTYTSLGSDVYYGVFAGKLTTGGELINVAAAGEAISVTVTGFTARDAKWDIYAGGLVGSVEGGTIENSSSRVNVTASNRTGSATLGGPNPYAYAGGIAGTIKSGELENIYAGGNIIARSYVQGTANLFATDDAKSYAGGIVGLQTDGSIKFSYAYGYITAEATSPDAVAAYAGGISGAIIAGTIESSLGISERIVAASKHPNGRPRGTQIVGRVAASATLTAHNAKIYGNTNLEFAGDGELNIWNGTNRSHYFYDLSWFWDSTTIAFNRGTTDSAPWIEDEYFKYPCPLTMCPIFYWER